MIATASPNDGATLDVGIIGTSVPHTEIASWSHGDIENDSDIQFDVSGQPVQKKEKTACPSHEETSNISISSRDEDKRYHDLKYEGPNNSLQVYKNTFLTNMLL